MSEALPLSTFQYSVWKGQQLHPSASLYNMCFRFDVFGPIDHTVFAQAFEQVVSERTILNLVIEAQGDGNNTQVFQKIQPQLHFVDGSANIDFDFNEWASEKNSIKFDLSQRSYYAALIKLNTDHFVFYINHHHIFNDVFSFQLLFNQIAERYEKLIKEGAAQSVGQPDLDEFILHQSAQNSTIGPGLRRPKPLKLYGESFQTSTQTSSTRHLFKIRDDMRDSITDVLAKQGLRTISPNLDLLTYLISSLVTTLSNVGDEKQAIDFSNIFSTRFSPRSKTIGQPAIELAHCSVENVQELSFEEIYQKIYSFLIRRESSEQTSEAVLPAVVFNFFELDVHSFNGFKTQCEWLDNRHMDDHHVLRFHLYRYSREEEFTLAIDVKESYPDKDIAHRFFADFLNVHRAIASKPFSHKVGEYCLLPSEELVTLNQELAYVNAIEFRAEDYILHQMKQRMQDHADEPALYFNDKTVTYQALETAACQVTKYLDGHQLQDGAKVMICMERSEKLVFAILGTLFANITYVPVAASLPMERLMYIVQDAEIDLLIHDKHNIDFNVQSIHFDEIEDAQAEFYESIDRTLDPFYIVYTSGSTGRPKGVPISHKSVSNYIASTLSVYLPEGEAYHMPLFTSIGFDLTVSSFFLPLVTGGSMYIYEEEDGVDLTINHVISNEKINCFRPTPSHINLIEDRKISANIQSIITGGEKLPRATAQKIINQSEGEIEVYNEYGPTEATVGCVIYKYDPAEYTDAVILPIGHAMKNTGVFIANASGVPVPQGVVGELCLSGPSLTSGYLNDQDLNDEKFPADNELIHSTYYRTGDHVRLNTNGDYEYVGRIDNQIKVRGNRIEPSEIEKVITLHPNISRCIVTYFEEESKRGQLVAYLQGMDIDINEIKDFASRYLPYYMVPTKLIKIDVLPLTSNGKLDTKQLLALIETDKKIKADPSNEIEEVMLSIWEEVLENEDISTDDDFFELGGASIDAIRIAARVEQVLNYKLPVNLVFELPSIRLLSKHILEDMLSIIQANQSES